MLPIFYYITISPRNEQENYTAIITILLLPITFATISIALTLFPETQRGIYRVIAAFGMAILLGFVSSSPALAPKIAISTLGLSIEREPVTLALTESGCNAVNILIKEKPCDFDTPAKPGKLTDAQIISRIGTQIVVHWKPIAAESSTQTSGEKSSTPEKWRRIILKKEDVNSWTYLYGTKKNNSTGER